MDQSQFLQLNQQVENILNSVTSMSRRAMFSSTTAVDREIKIEQAAGYPDEITVDDYYRQWKRNGVARRVIKAFPEACWKQSPEVYETEDADVTTPFEKSWEETERRVNIIAAMSVADELCGIGRYGIILLGVDDGKDLNEPVDGFDEEAHREVFGPSAVKRKLNFVRPISEKHVTIKEVERDPTSWRYGLPTAYSVRLSHDGDVQTDTTGAASNDKQTETVHWHRVLHITDQTDESRIFAAPRCESVYNDILDIKKISGASPEGYYQGCYPGLSFKLDPGYDAVDTEALRDQLDEYAKSLRRYISVVGMTVNTLAPNIESPIEHLDAKFTMLSVGTGIPKRILMGTEEGRLAGDQDGVSWGDRVQARRLNHLRPSVVLYTVIHLQRLGVLARAPEGVNVEWEEPYTLNEVEKADVSAKQTDAISKFAASGAEQLMSFGDFLHLILKLPANEVEMVLEKLEGADEPGVLAEMKQEEAAVQHDRVKEIVAAKTSAVDKVGDPKDMKKELAK